MKEETRPVYLLNAFSLNMVSGCPATIRVTELVGKSDLFDDVEDVLGSNWMSCVGHPSTAQLFSQVLGFHVECRRETISLQHGDIAVVGQYIGPRLPEGASELPEGAQIDWFKVTVSRSVFLT